MYNNNDIEVEIKESPEIPIPEVVSSDSSQHLNERCKANAIRDGEILNYDYLICPECGAVLHSYVSLHMKKHGINLNIMGIREKYNLPNLLERPAKYTTKLSREEYAKKYNIPDVNVAKAIDKVLQSFKENTALPIAQQVVTENESSNATPVDTQQQEEATIIKNKRERTGVIKEGDLEGYDYITCPECHMVLHTSLVKHFKYTHHAEVSTKDIREMYGNNIETIPYICRVRCGNGTMTREEFAESRARKLASEMLAKKEDVEPIESTPEEITHESEPTNSIINEIPDKIKYMHYLEIRMEKIKALFDTKISKIEKMLDELEEELHQM